MTPVLFFLKTLKENIYQKTSMDVFYQLPELSVSEPFVVLGSTFNDDSYSPKSGQAVQKVSLQVDLFLSLENGRLYAESDTQEIKRIIQQQPEVVNITSRTLIDKSIGRDIYHVILDVTAFL